MKHWVYSFMWRRAGEDHFRANGNALFAGNATELIEYLIKQPEYHVVTQMTEITEDEYRAAKDKGIIG